jgi:hypothetical protein
MSNDKKPYLPTDNPRVIKLVEKARKVNAGRDRMDSCPPSHCPLDVELRTVISALSCGISTHDWDCIAEGLAMIQDAEMKVRVNVVVEQDPCRPLKIRNGVVVLDVQSDFPPVNAADFP